jgi:hypothetical protein
MHALLPLDAFSQVLEYRRDKFLHVLVFRDH